MSHEMELPAFDRPQRNGGNGHAGNDLGRLSDVPVELAVEIGRTRMTVGETLELRPGSIVVLDRMAGEPVDLRVHLLHEDDALTETVLYQFFPETFLEKMAAMP